jgi:hypothetical protein
VLSFSTKHGAIPRRKGVSLISRLPVTLRRRAKNLAMSFNYNSGLPLLRGLALSRSTLARSTKLDFVRKDGGADIANVSIEERKTHRTASRVPVGIYTTLTTRATSKHDIDNCKKRLSQYNEDVQDE